MATRATDDPAVVDHPDEQRYELRIDGEVAGIASYRRFGDRIMFVHTEVDPQREGEGLGGRLARAVLDDARQEDLRVTAQCPFIASYIERHDEYADLVA